MNTTALVETARHQLGLTPERMQRLLQAIRGNRPSEVADVGWESAPAQRVQWIDYKAPNGHVSPRQLIGVALAMDPLRQLLAAESDQPLTAAPIAPVLAYWPPPHWSWLAAGDCRDLLDAGAPPTEGLRALVPCSAVLLPDLVIDPAVEDRAAALLIQQRMAEDKLQIQTRIVFNSGAVSIIPWHDTPPAGDRFAALAWGICAWRQQRLDEQIIELVDPVEPTGPIRNVLARPELPRLQPPPPVRYRQKSRKSEEPTRHLTRPYWRVAHGQHYWINQGGKKVKVWRWKAAIWVDPRRDQDGEDIAA